MDKRELKRQQLAKVRAAKERAREIARAYAAVKRGGKK